ncbi:hypothetical protein GM655_13485 [Pseudoduganella danionis]|uniref:Secreted protein n=2 Tax=Pseudoduganella danionis TaxID=1890295 RepID=A0ABW9SPN7_9BURK|nr:hypothetical protein [Pseudoduganella danionis]MTW33825.1 hypothetical protein [Pseudoduganella danionis]
MRAARKPLVWLLAAAVAGSSVLAEPAPAHAQNGAGQNHGKAQAAPQELLVSDVALDLQAAPVLSDELIRKAVRDTVAEDPHPQALAARNAAAYGAATVTVQDRMTTAFNQAKVPDCLHDDALKLQPAYIGPFAVVGPFSLPWVVAAALRGKCR